MGALWDAICNCIGPREVLLELENDARREKLQEEAATVFADLSAQVASLVGSWNAAAAKGARIRPASYDMQVIRDEAGRTLRVQAGKDFFGPGTYPVIAIGVRPGGSVDVFEGGYGPQYVCADTSSARCCVARVIDGYGRRAGDPSHINP